MNKKNIILVTLIFCAIILIFSIRYILKYLPDALQDAKAEDYSTETETVANKTIQDIIDLRKQHITEDTTVDPFDKNGEVKILLIGIDSRIGQEHGHCDAIQLITINKNDTGHIEITAVPRGTYSPLPPGTGTSSSDYYVSNACGIGGLDYGVEQIEHILGVKADYLAVVGFSQTLGIFRSLGLPSTETLQWLRNRHGYVIGEPQRAHNHSTFIKQMIVKYSSKETSLLDTPLQYIVYKLIKTDLSFSQIQDIIKTVSNMEIAENPEIIHLSMRPLYIVQDISYDPEHVQEYLETTLGPVKQFLSKKDYSDASKTTLEEELLSTIEENKDQLEFISWAYTNNVWLQIDEYSKRLALQYQVLEYYLDVLPTEDEQQIVLADYIIEMENRDEPEWEAKGKELLIALEQL